jgi:hypothetical protein
MSNNELDDAENRPPVYANAAFNGRLPTITGRTVEDVGRSSRRVSAATVNLGISTDTCTAVEVGREVIFHHRLVQQVAGSDVAPAWFLPALQTALAPIQNNLTQLKDGMTQLKEDVTQLKEDVTQLKEDVTQLKDRVDQVGKETLGIKNDAIRRDNQQRRTFCRTVVCPVVIEAGGLVGIGETPSVLHFGIAEDTFRSVKSLMQLNGSDLDQIYNVYREEPLAHRVGRSTMSRREAVIRLIFGTF